MRSMVCTFARTTRMVTLPRLSTMGVYRVFKNSSVTFKSNLKCYSTTTSTNVNSQLLEQQYEMYNVPSSVRSWIQQCVDLCQPDHVHICSGSDEENESLIQTMISNETLIKLNPEIRPNSYLARSDPRDVARVEGRTFICSETRDIAGPTNNWVDPVEMKSKLTKLFKGCMKGRTMYVIPFCMGPLDSHISQVGVQITDVPYVVVSMRIMTRMGEKVWRVLEQSGKNFVPCHHTVGYPLRRVGDSGEQITVKDTPWPCNEDKYIVHFPEERSIWSYGSGYGGNALLGKKCLALRIASYMAKKEGWLAEHMLVLGITNPKGVKKYIAASFPSACGKTNLAMLTSALPGWKVECIGDDIAWFKRNEEDGKLYAINPEKGFFGVAPGTSSMTNPNAMEAISKNTIFTNVATTPNGDVWWEGMTKDPPKDVQDWTGRLYSQVSKDGSKNVTAAHPNARFTAPISQCPIVDPRFDDPNGVPIEAILFGGRRYSTVPLVYQAFSWTHGTFLGSSMFSEPTSASENDKLRADPFAMKPFCGYNMAHYFEHWLSMGKHQKHSQLPKIFFVNWFRKDSAGRFIWPGFGDNIRVLKWIFERTEEGLEESSLAQSSPIGFLPRSGSIDLSGIEREVNEATIRELFRVDKQAWLKEVETVRQFYSTFGDDLPKELSAQLTALHDRLH